MVRLWWLRMFLHGNSAIASVRVHTPKGSRSCTVRSVVLALSKPHSALAALKAHAWRVPAVHLTHSESLRFKI